MNTSYCKNVMENTIMTCHKAYYARSDSRQSAVNPPVVGFIIYKGRFTQNHLPIKQ